MGKATRKNLKQWWKKLLYTKRIPPLLQLVHEPCCVEAITHRMMYLDRQRQQGFAVLTKIFPDGKDRWQVAISFLKVQIKPDKSCPRNTGDGKKVIFLHWFATHTLYTVKLLLGFDSFCFFRLTLQ